MRALFLDRDGTLNFDIPYNTDSDKVYLYPDVHHLLKPIQLGYKPICISNQSYISKDDNAYTEKDVLDFHKVFESLLPFKLFDYAYCYDYGNCRKPKPTMIHEMKSLHNIDVKNSIMIGDKISDIECGKNAGCKINILLDRYSEFREYKNEYIICKDLYECSQYIIKMF